jgi:hypothetical protein
MQHTRQQNGVTLVMPTFLVAFAAAQSTCDTHVRSGGQVLLPLLLTAYAVHVPMVLPVCCLCRQVLLPLLKTLKEVNMEFSIIDGRTFITGHPHALIR